MVIMVLVSGPDEKMTLVFSELKKGKAWGPLRYCHVITSRRIQWSYALDPNHSHLKKT